MRRRGWIVGIAVAAVMAAGTYALATTPHASLGSKLRRLLRHDRPADSLSWPNPAASLRVLPHKAPEAFGRHRVFIDPGHGAKHNTGNLSCYCEDEQDFTLTLAEELGAHLEATGHFEVLLGRRQDELVAYPDRVHAANAWGAQAFLSLHSDVRGHSETWSPEPGKTCLWSEDAPGFSVLWSDEPTDGKRSLRLARALAHSMTEAGFLPYHGIEYQDMYAGDDTPGVFVDRHPPGKRIYVLRKPAMPSIIVETHNALDPREARRFAQDATREAFFASVGAALVTFLGEAPRPRNPRR